MIEAYLKDIIINWQISDHWKIESPVLINFISSKDTIKGRILHSKNDNINFMTYDNPDENIEELFDSFLSRYQMGIIKCIKNDNILYT